jgi:hypothetical protein
MWKKMDSNYMYATRKEQGDPPTGFHKLKNNTKIAERDLPECEFRRSDITLQGHQYHCLETTIDDLVTIVDCWSCLVVKR